MCNTDGTSSAVSSARFTSFTNAYLVAYDDIQRLLSQFFQEKDNNVPSLIFRSSMMMSGDVSGMKWATTSA